MSDNELNKYKVNINSYGTEISNKVLFYTCKFLEIEEIYNSNKSFNFGIIPFYFCQRVIQNKIIVFNTINNSYESNINKLKYKILLVNILSILGNKEININDIEKQLDTFEIMQICNDNYNPAKSIKENIDYIYNKYKVKNKYINIFNIELNIVSKWLQYYNIDNIEAIDTLYYNTALNCIKNNYVFDNEYNNLYTTINRFINNIYMQFNNVNLIIPNNNSQEIAKIFSDKYSSLNIYKLYIYTSLLIYHPVNYKNLGNDFVFLTSKVYEDIINYFIYNYFINGNFCYTDKSWIEWNMLKQKVDEEKIVFNKNIIIINVKYLLNTYTNTHNIVNKLYNIDTDHIIIYNEKGFTYDYIDDKILIDWARNFQLIFKPFNNVCYYHNINNQFDLYSIYDYNFILIKLNNYDPYMKSIIQSYIHIDNYIDKLASYNNKQIYDNNMLSIINSSNNECTTYNCKSIHNIYN